MVGILQSKNTILKPFILAYAKVVGCALQFHRIEVYLKAIGMQQSVNKLMCLQSVDALIQNKNKSFKIYNGSICVMKRVEAEVESIYPTHSSQVLASVAMRLNEGQIQKMTQ